ncbi:hypothetical protein ACP45A_02915, partial [Vibrio genomosp. F10]
GYEPAKAIRDRVGGNIGVDSVVGLQSLAKPLFQKISAKKVGKHSIIKALNKLYKRGVYLPEKVIKSEDEALEDLGVDLEKSESTITNDSGLENHFNYSPNQIDKPIQ